MKYLYLAACLFCYAFRANAQFTNTDVRTEQLGLRTGATYWWSKASYNPSSLGAAEELYYRREHKHWALEIGIDYGNYACPLNYYATYFDAPGLVVAYDKEKLSAYSTQISLQYRLMNTERLRVYLGAFATPAYYYYKIHKAPNTDGDNEDIRSILWGGGLNCMMEYNFSSKLYASAVLQQNYLPAPTEFDRIHLTPEYKTSLLLGIGFKL